MYTLYHPAFFQIYMKPGSQNYHIYLGSRHHGEGGVTMYFLIENLRSCIAMWKLNKEKLSQDDNKSTLRVESPFQFAMDGEKKLTIYYFLKPERKSKICQDQLETPNLDEEVYILPNPTFLLGTYTANFNYHSDFYVSSCSNMIPWA